MYKKKSNTSSFLCLVWNYPAGKLVGVGIIGLILVGIIALFMGEDSEAFLYAKLVGMVITMAAGVWFFIRAATGRNH
jgi:ABC-type Na+ efflux pump permease subunit